MKTQLELLRNLKPIDLARHLDELVKARAAIGELRGACYGLPNPQLLLSPTILREALQSSEVENIVTTLEDVLQAQLYSEQERSAADKEVLRYNAALDAGLDAMRESYLGSNTIKTVHGVLVPREPDYRKTQNTLRNVVTGEVVFRPISAVMVPVYLADLEKFINVQSGLDPVLKTVIVHYQFEAIHPFGDGNGRTGRILMVLCMIYYRLLDLPVLFISEYINNHKAEYYRAFQVAERDGDLDQFIEYMLKAIATQARKSTRTLLEVRNLHEKAKRIIRERLPKIYSRDLVDAIFSQPLMTPTRYAELMECTRQTATAHLKALRDIGMMRVLEAGKYTFYANVRLMKYLNGEKK